MEAIKCPTFCPLPPTSNEKESRADWLGVIVEGVPLLLLFFFATLLADVGIIDLL